MTLLRSKSLCTDTTPLPITHPIRPRGNAERDP